jgi:hypothetical protein
MSVVLIMEAVTRHVPTVLVTTLAVAMKAIQSVEMGEHAQVK